MPTVTVFARPTYRWLAIAAGLLCAAAAHADVELTDLPGVVATANSCYLAPCDGPGLFVAANAIDNQPYLSSASGHGWGARCCAGWSRWSRSSPRRGGPA